MQNLYLQVRVRGESDCEQIEAVLKKVPKQKAPEVKGKARLCTKKTHR